MARGKRNMTNKIISSVVVAVVLAVIAFLQGEGILPESVNPQLDGEVYLHIIDVGQGSSALIQKDNRAILIDGGERDYGETVSTYITSCGITELSYVIASHPHSDHIGGLITVLGEHETGEVLMPEIDESYLPTTKTYESFLDAIADREISASYCEVGDVYYLDDISVEILGPVEQTDDLNNMSAVCKVSFGETDVMILGDAEKQELSAVYKNGGSFESEILIMGHHGSRTSIYEPLIDDINPEIAVISCSKDNSYGHPHDETIRYLNENGIEYFRTDYSGDVVFSLSGDGYKWVN